MVWLNILKLFMIFVKVQPVVLFGLGWQLLSCWENVLGLHSNFNGIKSIPEAYAFKVVIYINSHLDWQIFGLHMEREL